MSKFYPLEIVGCSSETQLQVGRNLNNLAGKRLNNTSFIPVEKKIPQIWRTRGQNFIWNNAIFYRNIVIECNTRKIESTLIIAYIILQANIFIYLFLRDWNILVHMYRNKWNMCHDLLI